MEKDNLVVLKTSETFFWEHEVLYPKTIYRCFTPAENGSKDYMVYGCMYSKEEYEMYFELAYDKVMRDWKTLGLVKEDGSEISFAEFKRRIDVRTFGKQTDNLRIGFVGVPKENQYAFYPLSSVNKALQTKEMYGMYQYVVNGSMYYLDNHHVKMVANGQPLSYQRK